jgi:flagellar motor switch protein FliM
MAKVLSQQEIDSLLSEPVTEVAPAPETDPSERRITLYDFKHQNRVSKDQSRTLDSVHTQFSNKYASALSAMLRSVVEVELKSVDQITYAEFIATLASHSCTYTFSMAPLEGHCLADFSPGLAFAFVDRVFGGSGKGMDAERELTGIELSVMSKINERAGRDLADAWGRLVQVEIETISVETTPQFTHIVPPGETILVATFQLSLQEVTGILAVCYPYVTLEPVLSEMSGQSWLDTTKSKQSTNDKTAIGDGLRTVGTDVSVHLAATNISMRDFLSVNVGDVIVTDTETQYPSRVFVRGIEKFTARPGLHRKRRAIEITGTSVDNRQ